MVTDDNLHYLGLAEFDVRYLIPFNQTPYPIAMYWVRQHQILLIAPHQKGYLVAISCARQLRVLQAIHVQTDLTFYPVLCQAQALQQAVQHFLQRQAISDNSNNQASRPQSISERVQILLVQALEMRASDIHLEPYERSYEIRLRIDGQLIKIPSPPFALMAEINAHIKTCAKLDITESRRPQDGRFSRQIAGQGTVHFRLSSCPTLFGEKLVIRILGGTGPQPNLTKLGLLPVQYKALNETLKSPHGLILVTGPTGSGKTLTLYSMLKALHKNTRNIITAENPIEVLLPGINQVNINPALGLDFANALRSFLRQDPDIIMIGEVRDAETAQIAVHAAQTGHLVLSSLHCNSAAQAVERLQHLGIPAFDIASCLQTVIAQRLIRLLCSYCQAQVQNCPHCHQGFSGRSAVFEVLMITESIQQMILQQSKASIINQANQNNHQPSLQQAAQIKLDQGLTNKSEIEHLLAL